MGKALTAPTAPISVLTSTVGQTHIATGGREQGLKCAAAVATSNVILARWPFEKSPGITPVITSINCFTCARGQGGVAAGAAAASSSSSNTLYETLLASEKQGQSRRHMLAWHALEEAPFKYAPCFRRIRVMAGAIAVATHDSSTQSSHCCLFPTRDYCNILAAGTPAIYCWLEADTAVLVPVQTCTRRWTVGALCGNVGA